MPAIAIWDIGKQCRPRSDTALYASESDHHFWLTGCSFEIWKKKKIYLQTPLKLENWLVLLIRVGKSIQLNWVKNSWFQIDPMSWVKVQNFKNPEFFNQNQILKLAVCLQSVNNFKFKWSIAQRWTENKSEKQSKSLSNSAFWGWLSTESKPQNVELDRW